MATTSSLPARFKVDRAIADASVAEYDDGLILPGGVANPDTLRQDHNVIAFLQAFVATGKPVGVICHGPWTLVEAICPGRTLTSHPSIRTDIRNAGGNVVDQEVVVDRLVSPRPDDLRRSAPRSSRSSPAGPGCRLEADSTYRRLILQRRPDPGAGAVA